MATIKATTDVARRLWSEGTRSQLLLPGAGWVLAAKNNFKGRNLLVMITPPNGAAINTFIQVASSNVENTATAPTWHFSYGPFIAELDEGKELWIGGVGTTFTFCCLTQLPFAEKE